MRTNNSRERTRSFSGTERFSDGVWPSTATRYTVPCPIVCSLMESSDTFGEAIETSRIKSGSEVSSRTEATLKFAAPRLNARRVSPGFSSRSVIVAGINSPGAGSPVAGWTSAPVNGTGGERPSSTVRRSHFEEAGGSETCK